MSALIEEHRDRFGVEPICRALQVAPGTYYARRCRPPSARALRDVLLKERIRTVHAENYGVYGAPKVWRQLNREETPVARCTVERLMHDLGLQGARRGKTKKTTRSDPTAPRPADLVARAFSASRPNQLWLADFTYVRTWSGFCYAAFVIDCYARMIIGWSLTTHMRTDLPLEALEMALWRRDEQLSGLIHHSDAGSQYLSIRYTERLAEAGIEPSVGSVGDSYDNALAETTIGLYKTELIAPRRPWRTAEEVELATLEWIDWFNHRRLHSACGDVPPSEFEAAYYARQTPELVDQIQTGEPL